MSVSIWRRAAGQPNGSRRLAAKMVAPMREHNSAVNKSTVRHGCKIGAGNFAAARGCGGVTASRSTRVYFFASA
jgi:hypothetical protein